MQRVPRLLGHALCHLPNLSQDLALRRSDSVSLGVSFAHQRSRVRICPKLEISSVGRRAVLNPGVKINKESLFPPDSTGRFNPHIFAGRSLEDQAQLRMTRIEGRIPVGCAFFPSTPMPWHGAPQAPLGMMKNDGGRTFAFTPWVQLPVTALVTEAS